MRTFNEIAPEALRDNVFRLIGRDWMLVTAGSVDNCNMMTASWGGLGILWHKPVAFIFIRPQRYTDEFVRREDYVSLCFFEEDYREVLNLCGTKSGRDIDKVKETGLTPREGRNGGVWFDEAKLVLECRKLYAGAIEEAAFVDRALISENYPTADFHHLYIAEVAACLVPGE